MRVEEKENNSSLQHSQGAHGPISYPLRRPNGYDSPIVKILLTGFGPFREHVVNASWQAVRLIPDRGIELPPNIREDTQLAIITYEIPVIYNFVADQIPKLWEKHNPDLVIHVGVSGIAKAITVEQFAHNCGYCSPDIHNTIPRGNVCIGDGCDVLESGFNMRAVAAKINSLNAHVHAEVSYDPGRYLCDYIFYTSLSIDKDKTAFIHVPPVGKPWNACDMADAISLCATELLRQLADKNSLQF